MKIQSVSKNYSFGALMLEKKPMSNNQRKIVNIVRNTILEDKYNIHFLEHKYTDIYISPNNDKKSVDLKLLTAAGLTYNYIPQDNNGEIKVNLHVPYQSFFPTQEAEDRLENNIRIRTRRFMRRGINGVFDLKDNHKNQTKTDFYEKTSYEDLLSNNLKYPENIPDALSIYGNPIVTTKTQIKSYL